MLLLMSTTSVSLLGRLGGGDAEAWRRFAELYTPLLYNWARRTGMQEADAADFVQDVFAHLLRKLPEFAYEPGRGFRGWLKTVAMNLWRDRAKRKPPPRPAGDDLAIADLASPDDLDAFVEGEYRAEFVRRALRVIQADFAPTTWKACWELVVAGRPAADVARELNMSTGAVHAARFRVLARLRQELDGLVE